jgi:hypothetical protein
MAMHHFLSRCSVWGFRSVLVRVVCAATLASSVVAVSGAQSPVSYEHYRTPGWCQAALTRLTTIYWRDKRQDTVVYAPLTDSVPTPVEHALAACTGARFTPENTPEHELIALVQLDLTLGRDEQARAAAEKIIANHARDAASKRGWVMFLVARSFLAAKPARLADGRRYLARLDALGASAGEVRVMAHVDYGEFATSRGALDEADAEYQAAIVASKAMSAAERTNRIGTLYMMYDSASEVTALHRGAPAALAMIEDAKTELLPLRPPGVPGSVAGGFRGLTGLYSWYGKKAEPLEPSHWYGVTNDTVRPKPGVTSLVILGSARCGARCYPQYATIRRLQAKYGSALNTTMVTGTSGYFMNTLVPTPAAESDSAGKYFVDFLKLPAGVAASEIAFTRKIDGRRNSRPSIDQRNYARGRDAVLVGRDGTIKAVVNLGPEREKMVADLIAADAK